jgi:hypothetical protein
VWGRANGINGCPHACSTDTGPNEYDGSSYVCPGDTDAEEHVGKR